LQGWERSGITLAHVSFDRIGSWPRPAQRPHPPVLIGGLGLTVHDRVPAFGDAWFPNDAPAVLGLLEKPGRWHGRGTVTVLGARVILRVLAALRDVEVTVGVRARLTGAMVVL
jgi:alkanesulfonate monooxygenase SsuD/methylene tetrahydromethanopterin reductase-like flavin-dependent oxidoreductase (luciferase family)